MYWIHTTNTYIPQDMPIQMKRIVMDWYFLGFQYLPVCTHDFTDEARVVIAQSTWSSRLLVSSEKSLGITRDLGLHDIEQIIMLSSTSQPSRWLRLPSWEAERLSYLACEFSPSWSWLRVRVSPTWRHWHSNFRWSIRIFPSIRLDFFRGST